jgi:FkbM family methyltransferase
MAASRTSRHIREFRYLRNRVWRLMQLMPVSSVVLMMLQRHAAVVDVVLRRTRSVCRLRPRSSDEDCLWQVFVNEEYLLPFPLNPTVIVDAGANIGGASLYFAYKYPDAKILALEPEASNFALLKHNCAAMKNIIPIQAALWAQSERVTLTDPDAEKWRFTVTPSCDGEQNIRGMTIEELMQEFGVDHIDLLKVDIEGAEKEVFGSGPTTWLVCVNTIAIELHDRYMPGCAQAFYEALHGRRFFQEVRGENVIIKLLHEMNYEAE